MTVAIPIAVTTTATATTSSRNPRSGSAWRATPIGDAGEARNAVSTAITPAAPATGSARNAAAATSSDRVIPSAMKVPRPRARGPTGGRVPDQRTGATPPRRPMWRSADAVVSYPIASRTFFSLAPSRVRNSMCRSGNCSRSAVANRPLSWSVVRTRATAPRFSGSPAKRLQNAAPAVGTESLSAAALGSRPTTRSRGVRTMPTTVSRPRAPVAGTLRSSSGEKAVKRARRRPRAGTDRRFPSRRSPRSRCRICEPPVDHGRSSHEGREAGLVEQDRADGSLTTVEVEPSVDQAGPRHRLDARQLPDRVGFGDGIDGRTAALRSSACVTSGAQNAIMKSGCPVAASIRSKLDEPRRAVDHVASTRPPARPATTAKTNVARTFSRNRDRARVAIAPIAVSLPWAILTGHPGKGNRASTTQDGCWHPAAVGQAPARSAIAGRESGRRNAPGHAGWCAVALLYKVVT